MAPLVREEHLESTAASWLVLIIGFSLTVDLGDAISSLSLGIAKSPQSHWGGWITHENSTMMDSLGPSISVAIFGNPRDFGRQSVSPSTVPRVLKLATILGINATCQSSSTVLHILTSKAPNMKNDKRTVRINHVIYQK